MPQRFGPRQYFQIGNSLFSCSTLTFDLTSEAAHSHSYTFSPRAHNLELKIYMAAPISKAEKSFIQAGILLDPPTRLDGRALHEFRDIQLETGVAPLASGSARLTIGAGKDGSGGTEVWAATKLEVVDVADGERQGVVCSVTW